MPSLGLSDADRAAIIKNVNVVIHCAANLDGKERLDTATMVSRNTNRGGRNTWHGGMEKEQH